MAEVRSSTSQSAVTLGEQKSSLAAFDLRSWQGLTQVLQAAREAGLSQDAYSEFRDLVLQYAQRGGDAELRKKIDATIATFSRPKSAEVAPAVSAESHSAPTVNPTPQVEEPYRKQMVRRPVPSFMPQHVVHTEETAREEVALPKPSQETAATASPATTSQPQTTIQETETIPTPITEEPSAVTPPPAETPKTVKEFKSLEEYKERIAEIKRTVNSQVGNPITLVDAGNQIGRTYMTALLTAMKATGSGMSQGVDGAMEKLEEAFRAIEEHLRNGVPSETVTKKEEQAPVLTPAPQVAPVPEEPVVQIVADKAIPSGEDTHADDITLPPQPISETTSAVTVPEAPSLDEQKRESDKNEIMKHDRLEQALARAMHASKEAALGAYAQDEIVTARPEEVSQANETVSHTETPSQDHQKETPRAGIPSLLDLRDDEAGGMPHGASPAIQDATSTSPTPLSQPIGSSKDTVASAHVLHSPELEEAHVLGEEVAVRQTELASPQVTSSLVQLLNEWSIFAGSGLFGMGPGGLDHPLYQKLSKLTMGEVIAGRWEDANPRTTRTIKDYVDAWRHEQGVAYNPTETFEHYLRRVVQRILKRQNGE